MTPVWIKWLVVVFIRLECNNLTWLRSVNQLNLKVPFMFSCIVAESDLMDWVVLWANFFLDVIEVIASASEQIYLGHFRFRTIFLLKMIISQICKFTWHGKKDGLICLNQNGRLNALTSYMTVLTVLFNQKSYSDFAKLRLKCGKGR